jgi:hypothetical protein
VDERRGHEQSEALRRVEAGELGGIDRERRDREQAGTQPSGEAPGLAPKPGEQEADQHRHA